MPRTDEKPFIMFRRGRFLFNITPRNAAGWRQFAAWMVLLAAMTGAFMVYVEGKGDQSETWWATGIYLVTIGVWSAAMIRWMRARAEVVDIEALLREQGKRRR